MKDMFRKSAILLLLFLVCAACLEGALRLVLGLGTPVLIAPDSASEYILKPDQRVTRFFAHTFTNHFGMRSEELPEFPGKQTLRLMFVGDSITYGTSKVDQANIFTEIVHKELPAIVHEPVEVMNASAGGWAIDNELSYVRSRGTFHANLVVLVLNSGDLGQPRAAMAQVGDDLPTSGGTAIGELWTRAIKPRIFHAQARQDAGDSANMSADQIIQHNLADLDEFRNFAQSQGARLAILYIPFSREIPTVSAQSAAILRNWTQARQVAFMDLTPAIAPYPINQISLDGGTHYNTKGNRVIADAIEKMWPSILPAN